MSLTPTLLLILDGYGLAPAGPGNAASLARTPNIDRLISLPGATRIDASGRAVGLPAGYMGNSEVGHLNIGAGRIVYQDMTRIDVAMETGELASNAALLELLANVKRTGGCTSRDCCPMAACTATSTTSARLWISPLPTAWTCASMRSWTGVTPAPPAARVSSRSLGT